MQKKEAQRLSSAARLVNLAVKHVVVGHIEAAGRLFEIDLFALELEL